MAEDNYTDRTYTINGQELHVIEKGKPGRQIALLIHGWSSSWYATSPLIDILASRFHCIAVDLPGYGQSPPFPERATIPKYVDFLADFLSEVSDGPAVLIGHSMGGMISATMAIRHPVLVERMVLLAPTITGRLSTYINIFVSPITLMERFGLGSLIVTSVESRIFGLTDRLMRPASLAERSGIDTAAYERISTDVRRPGQGRVRAECFRAMLDNDISGQINQIQTPTLILWGAEDNTVPLRDAGVVADEWPQADLRIFPKAGHWLHFERPDLVRRQVAAYLGLPTNSASLVNPVDEEQLVSIQETAQFLALSAVGNDLNLAQRTRLAAQCLRRVYKPGEAIAHAAEISSELFIIQAGTVEVWKDLAGEQPQLHKHESVELVATLRTGQITGELAMIDQEGRSADLIAGKDGALVLTLDRDRLLTLCEDDAVLGTRLLWNIATAMSRRVRFILWQLNRAEERRLTAVAQQPPASSSVPPIMQRPSSPPPN